MPLTLTREEVRELDRRAIEEYGIPSLVLMENAGRACTDEIEEMLAGARGAVRVLCGPGNNGGDGLVIARTLWNRGHAVEVDFVGPLEKLESSSEDVRTNARLWRDLGREIREVGEADELALDGAPLVVDALFGTGLTRPVRAPWATVIGRINAVEAPVLAVDLPSGLDANTGEVLGTAVHASTTVTFVARKPGFETGSGPELCGRVVVAEIGIPRFLLEGAE